MNQILPIICLIFVLFLLGFVIGQDENINQIETNQKDKKDSNMEGFIAAEAVNAGRNPIENNDGIRDIESDPENQNENEEMVKTEPNDLENRVKVEIPLEEKRNQEENRDIPKHLIDEQQNEEKYPDEIELQGKYHFQKKEEVKLQDDPTINENMEEEEGRPEDNPQIDSSSSKNEQDISTHSPSHQISSRISTISQEEKEDFELISIESISLWDLTPTSSSHSDFSKNLSAISESEPSVSILIAIRQDNPLSLRNCLKSLYDIIQNEEITFDFEIFLFEVGHLSPSQRFARRESILYTMEPYQRILRSISFVHSFHYESGFPSVSVALNIIVPKTSGNFLLFLSDKTEVLPGFFDGNPMLDINGDPSIGIVGSKLINGDNTIFHAGVDFIIGRSPGSFWWGKENQKNVPIPLYRYQGFSGNDMRVSVQTEVTAVTGDALMMPRLVFDEMNGLDSDLSDAYTFLDLSLRVAESGKKIIYSPSSVGMYFGQSVKWDSSEEYEGFERKWGITLSNQIREQYVFQNITLSWNMECGKGPVLGFTTEAIGFISGLYNKVLLNIKVNDINQCTREMESMGLPASLIYLLEQLSKVEVEGETVLVIHRDPGRYNSFLDENALYTIGRSMFETDRIPSDWISNCNNLVDALWVPTSFNKKTFTDSGVTPEIIKVMPEPIDTFLYDPSVVHPLHLPKKRGFNFLSVMKWEKRKGWNYLLEAYLSEFSKKDDVSLYIRSTTSEQDELEYNQFLNEFETNSGKSKEQFPQIIFLKEEYPYSKLPSLYKSVQCVVLATHGEGWGLPLIEGMSMNLPVIATNWSGNTQFMRRNNSYLVEVEEFISADLDDHEWAKPSVTSLRDAMKTVYENNKNGEVEFRPREEIAKNFGVDTVAKLVLEEIAWVSESIEQLKEQKEEKKKEKQKLFELELQKRNSRTQIKINFQEQEGVDEYSSNMQDEMRLNLERMK